MDTQAGDRSGDFSSEEPEFVEGDPEELCYRLHAINVLDRAWRAWRAVVAQDIHNELITSVGANFHAVLSARTALLHWRAVYRQSASPHRVCSVNTTLASAFDPWKDLTFAPIIQEKNLLPDSNNFKRIWHVGLRNGTLHAQVQLIDNSIRYIPTTLASKIKQLEHQHIVSSI